ncbi:hypothetical protein M472_02410 [Sphingobacterium paucimobilis HER1398]|uniref:Serine protease n=2 Tax=Sphingobacterium TaxID=28453 RepID=U2H7E3_9SPHI|nr:hypothetical protein M472_02410 [Sphingobacterium paucimobilis HER1398]
MISTAQETIDENDLFMNLVRQVRAPSFNIKTLDKVYQTAYIDKTNLKISINTISPSKKALTRPELYKSKAPQVYRFVKVFRDDSGQLIIENIATAFPISEDGYFCMNYHMAELFGVGSGIPASLDSVEHYFLADYAGNIVTIDSICSYNQQADVAIVKADTKGQKITAFALGDDLQTGDDVFIIAHPKAYLYYFSTGMINRFTQQGNNIYSRKMEIAADYAGGSSGGPIFDSKGNIAGMVSLTQSFYYHQKEQRSLQMVVKQAVPVSVIKALIK